MARSWAAIAGVVITVSLLGYLFFQAGGGEAGGTPTSTTLEKTPHLEPPLRLPGNANSADVVEVRYVYCIKTSAGIETNQRRQAIRATWLKALPTSSAYFFYIGKDDTLDASLQAEQNQHRDIVVLDNPDLYKPTKNKVGALCKWLIQNVKFTYVFMLNDQSFLNPWVIERETLKWSPKTMYRGHCIYRLPVPQTGPNAEPKFKDCPTYVPFCVDGAHVVSRDLINWVSRSSLALRTLVKEDAMFGLWMAALEGARPINDGAFHLEPKTFKEAPFTVLTVQVQNDKMFDEFWAHLIKALKAAGHQVTV